MHIKIKQGLDIPIKGKPIGEVQTLFDPQLIALDVEPFEEIKFKLLAKVGDEVKVGQPLLADKDHPERMFVSPAGGTVKEIRRGLKRRLLAIVIERAKKEEDYPHPSHTPHRREELKAYLLATGMFAHIHMRPFGRLANPEQTPRAIFVKAIESAPFVPPAELQIKGHEAHFLLGLKALTLLTDGPVHLITPPGFSLTPPQGVVHHTASGPHPIGNLSLHIEQISPIKNINDLVWTLDAHDVLLMGTLLATGKLHRHRVIGIGGEGVVSQKRGFFQVRSGHPLQELMHGRAAEENLCIISGNPLVGHVKDEEDFLGFRDFSFTLLPEPKKRKFLHFFRLGVGQYSHSRAYLAGHLKTKEPYRFTTSAHGEERAFIDGRIYDDVMPLRVPTMPLVKAVIGRNWEEAEYLGLLEVVPEDFALPTFVCPSKVEMCEIIKEGIKEYSAEIL
ncbi:MAG: Na(+)-translocating NADH-quinone reductase subunit A [Verrucomicrobia bacterium]|nr:Na(+)-translocating NADH-quinone reductase subunit A [Verrucomicrobiota bacterium]